ncbi:DUF6636 domain-containing protein [Chamaesiphon minutus]|uniref:Uncharacterized protein n=1 Tax=Chamaesiphon minutus (strain ATCC 27169 / PCC 6605) TaxID=1173020 RepID=K9UM69_CHAP6|nr:DUF6636 domain-containing protein [Chamaesiphon minutus]AFY96212.1 hypothetical protein Cha6605_5325 [Chamaesiphon minutus PCC 6605]
MKFNWLVIGILTIALGTVDRPSLAIDNDLNGDGFRLPSGNIACYLSNNKDLRCDIRSGLNPKPKSPCELDWTGISLDRHKPAQPSCAGDTIFGSYPVLNYGSTWKRAGLKCTARTTGLTCINPRQHGFFLNRTRWQVF